MEVGFLLPVTVAYRYLKLKKRSSIFLLGSREAQ